MLHNHLDRVEQKQTAAHLNETVSLSLDPGFTTPQVSGGKDYGLQDAFSSDATGRVSRRNLAVNCFGPAFCRKVPDSFAEIQASAGGAEQGSWVQGGLTLRSMVSSTRDSWTVWRQTSLNLIRKKGWHYPHRIWTNSHSALFFTLPYRSASGVRTQAPCWGREQRLACPQIHFALVVAGVKVWQTSRSQKAKQKKKSFQDFQDFQPRNKAALYKNY